MIEKIKSFIKAIEDNIQHIVEIFIAIKNIFSKAKETASSDSKKSE